MADTSTGEAKDTRGSGVDALESAKKYYQTMLSGSKPAVMAAASPAIDAINSEAEAKRTQQAAMGTDRGGGVNATNQEAESQRMAEINKTIAAVQPTAAKSVADIGGKEADIGSTQMREALQELGLSADVANEIINSSVQSRPISMQANAAVRQQWSNALDAMFAQ